MRQFGRHLTYGSHVTVSRNENSDLFTAATVGVGMIGPITARALDATANILVEPTLADMTAAKFAPAFATILA